MQFQKKSTPTHGRSSEIPKERGEEGSLKNLNLKAKYEAKLLFPGGGGLQNLKKKNFHGGGGGGVWIFSGIACFDE